MDTSTAKDNQVCLKFSRNGKIDVLMSEPFQLQVIEPCPKYFKTKDNQPNPPDITVSLSSKDNYRMN